MRRFSLFYSRYKEVVLLFLGFILTGVLGTYITARYQRTQQSDALKSEQLRVERQEALKAATDISEIIGKHHFSALQLRGAIDEYLTHPTAENLSFLNEQSVAYRASAREWNTSWNSNRTKLRMYFGSDMEALFYVHSDIDKIAYDQSITGLFNHMHNELVSAKAAALSHETHAAYDFAPFDQSYHAIGYLSYQLYNAMIKQIQGNDIGSFHIAPIRDLAPTYSFPPPTR